MTPTTSNVNSGVPSSMEINKHDQQFHKQITPAVPTIVITPPKDDKLEQDEKPSTLSWIDFLKKIQMPHRLA